MKRVLTFVGGVLSGSTIGTAVALLFTPRSGDAIREGLKQRYNRALAAGSAAAAQRRMELEAELAAKTGTVPADQITSGT